MGPRGVRNLILLIYLLTVFGLTPGGSSRATAHSYTESTSVRCINYAELNFSCCFCGCKSWFLSLREEQRLKIFLKSVLRDVFETEWKEII